MTTVTELQQEIANLEFMRPYFERIGPDATVRDVMELIAKEKAADTEVSDKRGRHE